MLEDLLTPEPHFVPGYTGYIPQYIFRAGDTFGSVTHKLLKDPCTNHGKHIVLPNQNSDGSSMNRPSPKEIEVMKAHENLSDSIYKYPTIPGYQGHVPFFRDKIGARFAVTSTEGIGQFEQLMLENKCAAKSLEEAQNRPPLLRITKKEAPGAFNTEDDIKFDQQNRSDCRPPHFMEENNPKKYIIAGYSGSIPFLWTKIGKTNKEMTHEALCDFMKDYDHKKCIEWTPITDFDMKSIENKKDNCDIYVRDGGLMSSYAGHVPGERFEIGQSYFKTTIDAKSKMNKASTGN